MTDHVKALRDIAENPEPMDEEIVGIPDILDILGPELAIFILTETPFISIRINGGMHPK